MLARARELLEAARRRLSILFELAAIEAGKEAETATELVDTRKLGGVLSR